MPLPMQEDFVEELTHNPGGIRADQLSERIFWEALELSRSQDRKRVSVFAERAGDLARLLFGKEKAEPAAWRIWYAGQLQGVARLLRALVGRELALETAAVVHSRKHARPILRALSKQDAKLTDLAKLVGIDKSQLRRELIVLQRHNLVNTAKEGKWLWARITNTGRDSFTEERDSAPAHYGVTKRMLPVFPNVNLSFGQLQGVSEHTDLMQ